MYEASVGLFVPYLRNLSVLLDKGVAYAETRKFNPAVLLGMRMAPNMYDLAQQIGEACRHATVAPALLAQCEPVALPPLEHDMAGLQARIATSIEFIESLPRAEIDAAAELKVSFRLKNGTELPFTGRNAAAHQQRPAILLSRHDRVRVVAAPRASSSRRRIFSGGSNRRARCSPLPDGERYRESPTCKLPYASPLRS
jgi:hypothetical protein